MRWPDKDEGWERHRSLLKGPAPNIAQRRQLLLAVS